MIGLIVARSKNNVIGKNGNIPWKIKGEQKQFRELTTGNVVIMGRKSYEEIGHPLPNRMNIVVSTTTEYQGDNLVSVKSLISIQSFSNQVGQLKWSRLSIKLYFNVAKASLFFSTAKSPCHPALYNPYDKPPHPANKSTYILPPHNIQLAVIIFFFHRVFSIL